MNNKKIISISLPRHAYLQLLRQNKNFQSNLLSDYFRRPIFLLQLDAFARALEETKASLKIIQSLDQSKLLIDSAALTQLDSADPNSFLICNLDVGGHVLCPVIRKNKDGWTVVLPNRGFRSGATLMVHGKTVFAAQFEGFEFPEVQLKTLNGLLNHKYEATPQVYALFRTISSRHSVLSLREEDQLIGNCLVTQTRLALEFAFVTASHPPVQEMIVGSTPQEKLNPIAAPVRSIDFGGFKGLDCTSIKTSPEQAFDGVLFNGLNCDEKKSFRSLCDVAEENKDILSELKRMRRDREFSFHDLFSDFGSIQDGFDLLSFTSIKQILLDVPKFNGVASEALPKILAMIFMMLPNRGVESIAMQFPNACDDWKAESANTLVNIGAMYQQLGLSANASACFSEAIYFQPTCERAYLARACARMLMGDAAGRSEDLARAALLMTPTD